MLEITVIIWCIIVILIELMALIRLRQLLALFHTRKYLSTPSMLNDLPSVSVCIPARNEQHAMTQCLESVLTNTYPKLEILVLDDASVDNTSSLIKSFAKDGVRFIPGSPLPDGWLGKNYALHNLVKEASGTYVLFLDVDTRLSTHSIAQLVAYAENTQANMISVLAQRSDLWRASVLLAPLRYFWHILFHRHARPVATSSAWMVQRKAFIQDFDGFANLHADVEPEVTIAAQYLATHKYKFLTSHQLLGVFYEKKMSSQIETIVRLRYPELGYSRLKTIGTSFLTAMIALMPILFCIMSSQYWFAVAAYTVGALCYYTYLLFVWERGAYVGMWLWPLILLADAWMCIVSMVRYETSSVTWKGRPVTSRRQET